AAAAARSISTTPLRRGSSSSSTSAMLAPACNTRPAAARPASSARTASSAAASATAAPGAAGTTSLHSSSRGSVYRHSSSAVVGSGVSSQTRHAASRRSRSQAGAPPSRASTALWSYAAAPARVIASADTALHLQLDQPVQLHRVLQRQQLRDRLDEAAHDHRRRLLLRQAAA